MISASLPPLPSPPLTHRDGGDLCERVDGVARVAVARVAVREACSSEGRGGEGRGGRGREAVREARAAREGEGQAARGGKASARQRGDGRRGPGACRSVARRVWLLDPALMGAQWALLLPLSPLPSPHCAPISASMSRRPAAWLDSTVSNRRTAPAAVSASRLDRPAGGAPWWCSTAAGAARMPCCVAPAVASTQPRRVSAPS